ncbi:unnamed protein product [Rangifer tarandus platyrhynchus]|uniref:Uncharacterized protein n=2 Tax=Rangifer tarandus platyrhynchus TaxID=3082113 RepID=A0AC59YRH5_RANTA|nr:unnamed protein product [Rangifer tarandus platyrhynchus]
MNVLITPFLPPHLNHSYHLCGCSTTVSTTKLTNFMFLSAYSFENICKISLWDKRLCLNTCFIQAARALVIQSFAGNSPYLMELSVLWERLISHSYTNTTVLYATKEKSRQTSVRMWMDRWVDPEG